VIENPHLWPPSGDDADESDAIQTELLLGCDALLMGRRTYEGVAPVWQDDGGWVVDFLKISPAGSLDSRGHATVRAIDILQRNAATARELLSPRRRGATTATVHLVVNDPFKALAHPIRRGIVERLAGGPATVGDATGGFGVSKPAISKHLKVLEETGVVRREVVGRTHRLSLEPDVLSEAADWMDRQRVLWGRLFDVVDEYLKEDKTS
jgi:DNA-binding transcriptional ArsR family regulator